MLKKLIIMLKLVKKKQKNPTICGLATNFALAAVENKLPNISSRKKQTKNRL